MTQASASPARPTPDDTPVFPPGRYGRRREPRRRRAWIRWAVPAVAIAIIGLITLKLYYQYGQDEFSPTILQYSNVTDTSITVKFRALW